MSENRMTLNQAVNYIQKNARYYQHGFRLPNGKSGGKYAVAAPDGNVIHSDDTHELVQKLRQ